MERYGVEWVQKGTHEKHLSVLEFEKKERAKEVAELDSQKQKITSVVAQLGEEVSVKKQELQNVTIEKELAEEATQKANEERTIAQQEKKVLLAGNQNLRIENNDNGEPIIFATQRGYGEFKDGWEFPGGKIEAGETPQEALKREIMEELDTKVKIGNLIDTIEYDYPNFHLLMDCFWCEIVSGELKLKEHENAKWLTKEHLDEVEWLPADVILIDKIRMDM